LTRKTEISEKYLDDFSGFANEGSNWVMFSLENVPFFENVFSQK